MYTYSQNVFVKQLYTNYKTTSFQSLTMRTLHDSTLIAYPDLCDALLGLTAKRQNILLHTHNLGSAPPAEEEATDSALQNTPFKPSSVFTVNDGFQLEVAKKQSSNLVAFHEVKMVNRSRTAGHTRAERIVDLTHVLERRRTIMDAGIIRIMKMDKELAVNSLALKVHVHVYMHTHTHAQVHTHTHTCTHTCTCTHTHTHTHSSVQ